MSGDLNVADAAVVLELEADLVAFSADLQRCDLSEHSDHWTRICPRLWSKVFQMSPHWLEAFPVPEDLAVVLRGISPPGRPPSTFPPGREPQSRGVPKTWKPRPPVWSETSSASSPRQKGRSARLTSTGGPLRRIIFAG
jgi:hypothetical protein